MEARKEYRKVAVLAADVADRIAAGEVVERPSSVVKELVENALDAGAKAIDVEIREGGRSLIRVSDDGFGMSQEDATLAIERHATSKIRDSEDLVGIRSFGFRGEALAAISSVSHLSLATSVEDGGGCTVSVSGGVLKEVEGSARRRGTTVTVESLFYNTPARQKFLKGARSEWRSISEMITTLAMVRRDVRFTVTHDGKVQFQLPVANDMRSRLASLYSAELASRLVAVDDVQGAVRVSGLVERPSDVGVAGRRTFISVNGRAIRDTGVVRAAESAYKSTIPAGVRPSLFLEIDLPGGEVDVNIHPAKAEVRFRDRWNTERAVERAVRRALGTEDSGAAVGYIRHMLPTEERLGQPLSVESLREPMQTSGDPLFDAASEDWADAGDISSTGADGASDDDSAVGTVQRNDIVVDSQIFVPFLTQFNRTYLAFERADALVLIDQHSAHERVLYERFMSDLESGKAASQQLLFPLTIHLEPAEAEAFEANIEIFTRLGFAAEGFGGSTLVVHGVPAPHPRFDAETCLRDTLASLTGDRMPSVHAKHERLAATVACKAAIKAGDLLSPEEMRALYVALARTVLPAHDVHGRATILQLSWDEIDRRFGRR